MDHRIIELYDEYTHRPLDRRVFLERLIALAGSAAAANAVLAVIEPNYAQAAIVDAGDSRIGVSTIDVAGADLKGYLAFPKSEGPEVKTNLVIVIHENRGLNPHIQDIARRLAVDGFHAIAPDFLTPLGGTPDDADKARDMFAKLDMSKVIASAASIVSAYNEKNAKTKVGAIGFCWGGGVVNSLATASPKLDAGVVFYGVAPKVDDVPKIKASMMMHHAGLDQRVNATLPPYEAALKSAKIDYQLFMYDGVNHAFNNDTGKERYNEAAAKLAWSRSVAFLKSKLA